MSVPLLVRLRRLVSAIFLAGMAKQAWVLAIATWIFLAIHAWYGSPMFATHLGMPQPGTFPRYSGTIRVDDSRECSRYGCAIPRYFIRTAQGEVEFHCGYQPRPTVCILTTHMLVKPDPTQGYVLGYDPYWGLDYVKHPPDIAFNDDRNDPKEVNSWRIHSLRYHKLPAWIFVIALVAYGWAVCLSYQRQARPPPSPQPPPPPPAGPPSARRGS